MPRNKELAYFAAPLFNDRERSFNSIVVEKLEQHVNVFLPQRDGALLADMLAAGVPRLVAERRVFDQDRQAMRSADILIAVLDGGYVDEGVAFEVGFMHAFGKPSIGLQTDVRRALPSGNNPMIAQGLSEILGDVESLVLRVADFARNKSRSDTMRA
jgi:nucleoside 2-deoxyribosyltransferase